MNPKAAYLCLLRPEAFRPAAGLIVHLSGGLVAALLLLAPVSAQSLLNSGFEQTTSGFPTSWTKPYAKGYESYNTNTARIYTGTGSLRIDDTGTSAGEVGAVRSAPVPITGGRKYIASIKCWLASGTTVSYYLEYRNAAGSILDAAGNVVSSTPFVVTNTTLGSWQTMTVIPENASTKQVLAAPPGATNITVMAYSPVSQQGNSYWDSASVLEVENVAVANASFETLDGASFPTDWTKPYGNGYESSSTTQKYLGTRSLRINDTSPLAGGVGGVRSAQIPVIPGRKYMANIKCYISSGTAAELHLEYWNAAGTKMMSYVSSISGTGVWKDIPVIPEEPITNVQIVAPHGASYLTIMAYSPVAQSGISYFDAAQVLIDHIDFATGGVIAANPGFENVDGQGFPLEWSKYGDMGYESGSTGTVFAGTRSVRINDTSASAVGGVESRRFPVIEGKSYTLTARCYVQGGAAPDFRMYVRYFDNEPDLTPNSYTADEYLNAAYVSGTQVGTWQTLTFDFIPPFLAKYASILLYSSTAGVGDGYFDAVTLAAKANSVSNGSFEDWSLSGYPHSWTGHLNSAAIVTSGSATRSSDIARSLKIVDTSASEGGGARSNRITTVTAGQAYTAAAQFYLESGTLDLYIEFWNASDVRLAETHATVSTTGSWQPIQVTGTAPTGTTYATVLLYSSVGGTCVGYVDAVSVTKDVVDVASRRQLLIDDYVVKTLANVTRTYLQGEKRGPLASGKVQPVVTQSKSWETPQLNCYGSMFYDATDGLYKVYYSTNGANTICIATCPDLDPAGGPAGGVWSKPLFGTHNSNRVFDSTWDSDHSSTLSVVMDTAEPDAAKRYKAFGRWRRVESATSREDTYRIYYSTAANGGKVFTSSVSTLMNGWDVGTMAYDASNNRFVASVKYYDNVRRVHRMAVSNASGTTWSVPIRNESLADVTDVVGHIDADSYGIGIYPYEGVYIGFNWLFQIDSGLDQRPGQQVGLITPQLAFSRDLAEAWHRQPAAARTALIERGASGAWDDGVFYTATTPVRVGDYVYLAYSASSAPHAAGIPGTTASIGLVRWRLDGFVSLNSAATEGTVLTKKLTFTGSSLKLNVDASGSGNYAMVELLDATGAVIPGYAKANSAVINTSDVNATVTWGGSSNIAALAGQTIQVKFYTKGAKLYAFQFQ